MTASSPLHGLPSREPHWLEAASMGRERISQRATPIEDDATVAETVAAPSRMLLAKTPGMVRLLEQIRRVACKHVTVLVEGETGTGKELVARAIHQQSPRSRRPFVAVNCAELAYDAAESRLFGHRKGSFTGAIDDHKGFFEEADRGTLFLDEVGELGLTVQGKLLRALQEGEIVRFGDSRPRRVDVRVVAATNRNLEREVRAGRFRSDLLYRLKVVSLGVPALRERREDLELLIAHLIGTHARRLGVRVSSLTPAARRALAGYDFPGNVRELEHILIRALVLSTPGSPIDVSDLGDLGAARAITVAPAEAPQPVSCATLPDAMARYERMLIERALSDSHGNRSLAARKLGISRRWLLAKLQAYRREAADNAVAW